MSQNIISVHNWKSPASNYPRLSCGVAEISSTMISPGTHDCDMRFPPGDEKEYSLYENVQPLEITELKINGKTLMTDAPSVWWSIQEDAKYLHGHVVCAGLGLGLMCHALNNNPNVKSITVIEHNKNIIDLVSPLIPEVEVIEGDWYEHNYDRKFDSVFCDLANFSKEDEEYRTEMIRDALFIANTFPDAKYRINGIDKKHRETLEMFTSIMKSAYEKMYPKKDFGFSV